MVLCSGSFCGSNELLLLRLSLVAVGLFDLLILLFGMDLAVADFIVDVVVEVSNGERAKLFLGIPSSIRMLQLMQNEMIAFAILKRLFHGISCTATADDDNQCTKQ